MIILNSIKGVGRNDKGYHGNDYKEQGGGDKVRVLFNSIIFTLQVCFFHGIVNNSTLEIALYIHEFLRFLFWLGFFYEHLFRYQYYY